MEISYHGYHGVEWQTVQLTVLCDLAETVQSSVKWLKLSANG